MPVQSGSLDPNTIKLHRRGAGPSVVLLHCLGVDRHLWDIAANGLERDFCLLSYDFPGHGETPVPTHGYGVEQLSDQLAAVLRREGVGRAHVVGISLGGLVAQHFAARNPAVVDRLVLVDTTPRYVDEMRKMWVERAATARAHGVPALIDGLLEIWFTPEFRAGNPPAVQYVRDTFSRASGEGYALACEALGAADLRPLVKQIAAATLVACGENDVPPFLDAARWLADNVPQARLAWIGPARHASILEQPEKFCRALREFLA
jgi:3-oxoadipate enol-lactonase